MRRVPTHSGLRPEIWRVIDHLAAKHHASRSWVVAKLLADQLGITTQEDFR